MGYRAELYLCDKKNLGILNKITGEELINLYGNSEDEDEQYPYRRDLLQKELGFKEIYQLGEPSWGHKDFDKNTSKVFDDEDLHDHYNEDNEMVLLNKSGLKFIIDHYQEKIINFYKKDLKTIEGLIKKKENSVDFLSDKDYEFEVNCDTLLSNTKSMLRDWENYPPYNLDNPEKVTGSWKYEYAIFQLAHLYKTIDWGKSNIIYTAG